MLEAIVRALTPVYHRQRVVGDLREAYVSPQQYIRHAPGSVAGAVLAEVRRISWPDTMGQRLFVLLTAGLIVSMLGREDAPSNIAAFPRIWRPLILIGPLLILYGLRKTSIWVPFVHILIFVLTALQLCFVLLLWLSIDTAPWRVEIWSEIITFVATLAFALHLTQFKSK